jgi:MFS family permease
VVNAYPLSLGALMLTGGSLGDLYGRRKVFNLGLTGFAATSVLCAVAPGSLEFFNIAFFAVVVSTLIQGLTLVPLARWLGVAGNDHSNSHPSTASS